MYVHKHDYNYMYGISERLQALVHIAIKQEAQQGITTPVQERISYKLMNFAYSLEVKAVELDEISVSAHKFFANLLNVSTENLDRMEDTIREVDIMANAKQLMAQLRDHWDCDTADAYYALFERTFRC